MEVSCLLHASAALPQRKEPQGPREGGWVGSRAGLDAVMWRKIPSPYRDSNTPSSSQQPSAIPLSYRLLIKFSIYLNLLSSYIRTI
jgi:hypothetical protein